MFPFIIMGFYEKEKTQCVGKKLVIKKDKKTWAGYYEETDVPIYDVITSLQLVYHTLHDPGNFFPISNP